MTARCEPPPELREWVITKRGYYYRENFAGYTAKLHEAGRYTKAEADREASIEPDIMQAIHAPAIPATPAEVEALRAERDEWKRRAIISETEIVRWANGFNESQTELTTLRARVADLEGALEAINLKDTFSTKSWGPYAVIARAALSPTPDRAQGGQ